MTVANVAFTGNYSHEGLTPTGKVILRRLTVMVILGETIFVIDPPTVAYIDGDGNVAGTLITDDALEAGVIYRVTEEVDGQNVPPVYDIVVIAGTGPIDLTTVARTLSVDAPRSQFEPAGAVAAHNISGTAHADLRALIAAGTTPDQLAAAIGTYLATHPEGSDDVDVSTFLANISALFSGSPGYTEAVALLAGFGITVPDTPVTLDDFQLMVIAWSLGENQNLQEGFALLAFLSAANVFTQGQTIALPADTNMGDTFDVLKTSIAGQMRLRLIAGATGTSYQQGLQLPLYLADDTPVGDSFLLSAADIAGDGSGFVLLAIRIANGSIFDPTEFAPLFIKGLDGNPGFAVTSSDLAGKADKSYVDSQDDALGARIDGISGVDISGKADTTYVDSQDDALGSRIDGVGTRIDDLGADEVAYDDIYSPAEVALAATMTDGHTALADYTGGTPQTFTVRVDSLSGADNQTVTLDRDYTVGGLTYDDLAADIQSQVTGCTVVSDPGNDQISFTSNTTGQNSRMHVGLPSNMPNGTNGWYDGSARGADAHADLHSFPGRDAGNVRKATDLLAARTATLSAYQRLVPVAADAFFDSVESAGPYTVDSTRFLTGKLRHNGSGVVVGFANPGPGLYAEVDVDLQNEVVGGALLNVTFASYVQFAQTYFDTTKNSTNLRAFVYGTEFTDPIVTMWQTSIGDQ